ncbi:MAG: lactam utilization protein LamB [Flavobacteriaceae bacterium]|nr:MAG: lactam utilization protein LamB [Flavobacteriaceae bacterium]
MEIDINCDVGEGIGNEKELFPLISSCNIACGAHAGDLTTMDAVVQLAIKYNVKVGAHPSYPDRNNFGRVSMEISAEQLQESIKNQVDSLRLLTEKYHVKLHHIKAHGALYNDLAKNEALATVYLEAIEKYKHIVFLYVPYGSKIETLAVQKGFKIKKEAFGDRNYNADLSLVSRKLTNALIQDPTLVINHIVRMLRKREVRTVDGEMIAIEADTFCIHGDTPAALQILMYLSVELTKQHIFVTK